MTAAQCGVFSTHQARSAGWTRAALRWSVGTGELVRLRKGAYQIADLAALAGSAYEVERWRHAGPAIAAALTINISHGGLSIRTTNPLAVDTPVKVRFRLPNGNGEIEAQGRVAWSDRRLGMGVRFTKIDEPEQAQIDDYVHAHFFSNRKA